MKYRVIAFFYNNQTNYIIATILILICAILIKKNNNLWLIQFIPCLYVLWNFFLNKKRNEQYNYFNCNYFLFSKKRVWINQKVFTKELHDIYNHIPKGTICYCCTHEIIKKHIIRKFRNSEVTLATKKNLIKLKKKLKTNKCSTCSLDCSLLKSDITQFYSIKFVKS